MLLRHSVARTNTIAIADLEELLADVLASTI
jgi:hypothetical protein